MMKDRTISLKAAIEAIYSCAVGGKEYIENAHRSDHFAEGLYDAVSAIEDLPSVTPQPKMGHWILLDECVNSGYYCSECLKKVVKEGWSNTVKKIKYCPNCGVNIRGDDNEQTTN